MSIFDKFFLWIKSIFNKIMDSAQRGKKWIGTDGIINMETASLLTIFFMIFLPVSVSSVLSVIVAASKCFFDKKNGHNSEMHDFICCIIGMLFGVILGIGISSVAISL